MQDLAAGVDQCLRDVAGEKVGFLLMTFTLGQGESRPNYVSNCDRAQMIESMQACIELLKQNLPHIPNHKIN